MAQRAVVTLEVYVYGDDDKDIYLEAKRIQRKVLDLDDNRASIKSLIVVPTGTIDPDRMREIDLSKMEMPEEL